MKVSIIGAGNVGAAAAVGILSRKLADVVLVDAADGLAEGKALDMAQSAPLEGYTNRISGTSDISRIEGSSVVVITAGMARKPCQTRADLLAKNSSIVREIISKITQYCKEPVIVVVTNPLDLMTYLTCKASGLKRERIVGMAGVLDCARFRYFVSQRLGVAGEAVETLILGEHGETMVILPRFTFVNEKPLCKLLSAGEIEELIGKAKSGGAQIVSLLQTTSAFYAPGSAAASMVECILKDTKTILPASVYLNGEYGYRDLAMGVPVKLGRSGVEDIIELELNDDEKTALAHSAEKIKKDIEGL